TWVCRDGIARHIHENDGTPTSAAAREIYDGRRGRQGSQGRWPWTEAAPASRWLHGRAVQSRTRSHPDRPAPAADRRNPPGTRAPPPDRSNTTSARPHQPWPDG